MVCIFFNIVKIYHIWEFQEKMKKYECPIINIMSNCGIKM